MQTCHRFDLNLNIPIIHIMFMFLHQSRMKLYHEFSLYLRIRKVENYVFPAYSSHVNFLTQKERARFFLSFHFLQHLNQNPSQASLESAFQSPTSPPKKKQDSFASKTGPFWKRRSIIIHRSPPPCHTKRNKWIYRILGSSKSPICPSLRESRRLERFHCQWSLRWKGLPQGDLMTDSMNHVKVTDGRKKHLGMDFQDAIVKSVTSPQINEETTVLHHIVLG